MPISDAQADEILNDRFRTTNTAGPATVYVALFASDPGRVYSAAQELAATGGYARVPIAKGDASWTAPATVGGKREITNAALIDFGTASGTWNSGAPVAYFGLMTTSGVGTGVLVASGAIDAPKAVGAGDPVSFPNGSLRIRL